MPINLEKGQRIDLTKGNSSITRLHFGLGWDPVKAGFFSSSSSVDLDGSAILLDDNKQVVSSVYFGNLKTSDRSVVHSGDNRTGDGDGDDEVIIVDIPKIPSNVTSIVFTINSFLGQTFDKVANATCRILDTRDNSVLATYNLTSKGSHTAIIIGSLYKHNSEWKFRAIGELANGRTVNDLQHLASQLG